jgi:hypothetical protein
MTTRLWRELESAFRQFQRTVQPIGMMTRASPLRYPLSRADAAPRGLVTSIESAAVLTALSATSHGIESELGADGALSAAVRAGVVSKPADPDALLAVQPESEAKPARIKLKQKS